MNPLFAPLFGLVDKALERLVPDVNQRKRMAHEIATKTGDQAQDIMLAQMKINAIEAASDKWWKAGWRPAVGWVCVLAMANNFILLPYALALNDAIQPMDWAVMAPVLMGMLGLGTLRTGEKIKGVA